MYMIYSQKQTNHINIILIIVIFFVKHLLYRRYFNQNLSKLSKLS